MRFKAGVLYTASMCEGSPYSFVETTQSTAKEGTVLVTQNGPDIDVGVHGCVPVAAYDFRSRTRTLFHISFDDFNIDDIRPLSERAMQYIAWVRKEVTALHTANIDIVVSQDDIAYFGKSLLRLRNLFCGTKTVVGFRSLSADYNDRCLVLTQDGLLRITPVYDPKIAPKIVINYANPPAHDELSFD